MFGRALRAGISARAARLDACCGCCTDALMSDMAASCNCLQIAEHVAPSAQHRQRRGAGVAHGATSGIADDLTGGDGQGPIVQSGAYSGVPNYADRDITVGSIHYVITNGRNAMGSYAGQLNAGDRWRVAMYVMSAFKKGGTTASAASTDTAAKTDSTATKK